MAAALKYANLAEVVPLTMTIPGLDEKGFLAWCDRFPDYQLEYSADGELIIMPPASLGSGYRNSEIGRQLANWSIQDGRGKAFDSSTGFVFPSGARRSPDAAWVDNRRTRHVDFDGGRFVTLVPDFVVELKSPSDRVKKLEEKMEAYLAEGVKLGWLVDPDKRTVTIFRPRRRPLTLLQPESVKGDGPVAGFVLEMARIWNIR